jgi:hypothetical protein
MDYVKDEEERIRLGKESDSDSNIGFHPSVLIGKK